MQIISKKISFSTNEKFQLVNITSQVEKIVKESNVNNGFCLIFAPHATAALIANENEAGLIKDILGHIKELFPTEKSWQHNRIDDNAHAHVASAVIGAHLIFPIIEGKLVRGSWQDIFFVEMDGPRANRQVIVQIMGE